MDDPAQQPNGTGTSTEVPRDDWATWCAEATERQSGRELVLYFEDEALGSVRLAEGQPFVAIEHDELGPSVAFTIKYGSGVVPVRYVIAEPRQVTQQRNDAGEVHQVLIIDSTNRRTFVSLA